MKDEIKCIRFKSLKNIIFIIKALLVKFEQEIFTIEQAKNYRLQNLRDVTKLLLLLSLKKVSSARLGESDIHPISPKTPATQYQPIDRKKRKERE